MANQFEGTLQLASKGLLYGDLLPEGLVQCNPWSTEEERIFVSPSIDFDDALSRVIKNCTNLPFPPDKLLIVDRQHLFLYMRCLSYGADYSFPFPCEQCNTKVTHNLNLEEDLDTVYADDKELLESLDISTISEPFKVSLPVLQKQLGWRMLRGEDEKAIKRMIAKDESRSRKSSIGGDGAEYIYRLALRIVEFDGQPVKDILEATEILRSIRGKDLLAIRQDIQAVNFGVQSELEIKCTKCGYSNSVMMPLDKSFFLPKRRIAVH
jgi:hypothetical protein